MRTDRHARRELVLHALALGVALMAVWPLLHLDGVFTADEGSYGVQARALRGGAWDVGYAFFTADPAGEFVPFHGATVAEDEVVAYANHPAWSEAQALATKVVGEEAGLRLLGVVSVVVAAVVAWMLAADLVGSSGARLAFWVVAASPVLANAWISWAHAPSTAAAGLLVLAGWRSRGGGPWWIALAALASAGGVLLRSEGLLWSIALGAALVLVATSKWSRITGAVTVGAAVVAWAIETRWVRSITGGAGTGLEGRGTADASGRLGGLRIAAMDGAAASQSGRLLGVLAVALVAAAALTWRRRPGDAITVVALLLAGAAMITRVVNASEDPILGLLPAAPVLILGLWARPERRARFLAVGVALYVIAIGLTVYGDGGGLQWGGRFLSPLLVPLAVLVSMGWSRLTNGQPSEQARLPTVALGILLCCQAFAAVVIPDAMRASTADRVTSAVAQGSVLLAPDGQVPRLDWRGWPTRCWIGLDPEANGSDLARALDVLRRSGVASGRYAGFERRDLEAAGASVSPDRPGSTVGAFALDDVAGSFDPSPPYQCKIP